MSHARAYDYVLGGKENYAVDRAAAERVMRLAPDLPSVGKAQRALLLRVVRECAEAGIDQFLDIGTGIPTAPNVHETAQAVNPDAHVVYVDYDPIVTIHNTALLADDVRTVSVEADVRLPQQLMDHPRVREQIDFSRPLLTLFSGLLHLVRDEDDPYGLVAQYRDRMASGSHILISHFCTDSSDPAAKAKLEEISEDSPSPMYFRRKEEIVRFFDGFDLREPGVVDLRHWCPEVIETPTTLRIVAGVGTKP